VGPDIRRPRIDFDDFAGKLAIMAHLSADRKIWRRCASVLPLALSFILYLFAPLVGGEPAAEQGPGISASRVHCLDRHGDAPLQAVGHADCCVLCAGDPSGKALRLALAAPLTAALAAPVAEEAATRAGPDDLIRPPAGLVGSWSSRAPPSV
jgi:hypothetical protein